MNRNEIVFSTIKVPLDFLIIFWSFFVARQIRLITDLIPSVSLPIQTIDINSLSVFAILWALLYIFLLSTHSIYSSTITSSKIKEFLDIIRYSIYWFIFFGFFVYLWKWILYEIEIPRLIILFTLIIWTSLVIIERIILNYIQYLLIKKWVVNKKWIIIINNKEVEDIKYIIEDIKKAWVYKIAWYINKQEIKSLNKIKYIWDRKDFEEYIEKNKCSEVLLIDSDFNKKELFDIWDLTRIYGIRYRYITNYFDITNSNTTLSLINSIATIEINNTKLNMRWRVIKRMFDIFWSLIWIIILSPIIIAVYILIKIEDIKAPAIYKNKRVWQNRKIFKLYKFRYLKRKYCIKECYWVKEKDDKALDFEKELIKKQSSRKWPLYKIKNDPRKTKIWEFIEKYSIDEIPQFFNVLIWNMSLVWPRPHQPREVINYKLKEQRVLTIKPWITWMSQVNWRDKNNFEDEANLDIFYIENWSLILDLKIIFKTFWATFKR